ncbi:MAG: regulatory protein RecX [Candidatus Omnitrophica bacterium]|nr:regulatory protein RecX [Candidatus Omnitrophota bacterium]
MIDKSYADALAYSLKLLKIRPRSIFEVNDRLSARKQPPDVIMKVISSLRGSGHLNDLQFAKAWVEDRMNFNPKAPAILARELKQKGLNENIIETVLGEAKKRFDFNDVASGMADTFIKRLGGNISRESAKRRVAGYLKRRGFSSTLIDDILNKKFDGYETQIN